MLRRILALSLLGLLPLAASPAQAEVATGRFDYTLSWNGIPAASAAIDVSREAGGVYRVEAGTRTNAFVDFFWRLRGRVESRFDDSFTPLGFRFDREINRRPELTEIAFGAASPFATGSHRRNGETKIVEVGEDGILDPVTAIFAALQRPIIPGGRVRYDVFTGNSRYLVELTAGDTEVIRVDAGTFAALRLEPRVWKVGTGLEPRLRGATIWVAEGPIRIPVRIRTEVFVGAVDADLQRQAAGPAS